MTMQNCGVTVWPQNEMNTGNASNGGAAGIVLLDSTTDCLYWVGRSPIADSLTTVYFRTGSIPAAGGDTLDVRIETVLNGRRTGTLWGANTNVTVAVADTDDQLWKTATLTSAASLAVGDEFAIVIASSTGTPSINLSTSSIIHNGGRVGHYPVIVNNVTGTDVPISSTTPEWIIQFSTAGIKYIPGLTPIDGAMTLTAFNNTSSPDELALRFQSTVPRRVIGARAFIGNIAAGADFSVSLWDASGTTDAAALAQASVDGDFQEATTSDGYVDVYFDTAVTLAINTTYYLGVRADTANSLTLFSATTAGTGQPANSIKAFSHESAELYLATRTWTAGTAGAWTTTTTTYPFIALLFDQLDDGVVAGGAGPLVDGRLVR